MHVPLLFDLYNDIVATSNQKLGSSATNKKILKKPTKKYFFLQFFLYFYKEQKFITLIKTEKIWIHE